MYALTTTDAILRGDDKLGGIWGDDAEVWHLVVRKWYVARDEAGEWSPGVRIVIRGPCVWLTNNDESPTY